MPIDGERCFSGIPMTVGPGTVDIVGTGDFDAVNYRQIKRLAAGVAGVSAMANIPQVAQDKTFAAGVGLGNFQGQIALAVGASYRMAPNAVVRASLSTVNGERRNTAYGVGVGFSW
jgi:autotransporter adhesin